MSTVAHDEVNTVTRLPMGQVFADEQFNCRGKIAPIDVVDLAKSIEEQGLIQPIIVQPYNGPKGQPFRVVAGYRRYMAHIVNKAEYIDCIIRKDLSDDDALFLNLTENLGRQDLNLSQEAKAVERLLDKGHTQEEIRRKLNISRGWVQVRVYYLDLPPMIKDEVNAGWIRQEHIHTLNSLKNNPERQLEVAKQIKERKQSNDRTRIKMSAKSVKKDPNAKIPRNKEQIQRMIDHIIQNIGSNFGTRCLAWSTGEVSTSELYEDIGNEASDSGKDYYPPDCDVSMEI